MRQLAQENADYDLTTAGGVAVLTQTPNASGWTKCAVHLAIGDGTKDLDGTGGDFDLYVTIGGKPVNPYPQTITFAAQVTAAQSTDDFVVPPNAALVVKIKSPNGADTDVDVTATLVDVGPLQPSVALTQLAVSGIATLSNQTAIAAYIDTEISTIINLLEADRYIDTSTTPWQLVLIEQGTGALGVGTELLRQNLKDESGVNLTSINDFVGQQVSP